MTDLQRYESTGYIVNVGSYSIAAMIEKGNFDSAMDYVGLQHRQSMLQTRFGDVAVSAVHIGRPITNADLVKELPNLVDPLTALNFAAQLGFVQQARPTATVWTEEGEEVVKGKEGEEDTIRKTTFYNCLILAETQGRSLSIYRASGPDVRWHEDYDFLIFG